MAKKSVLFSVEETRSCLASCAKQLMDGEIDEIEDVEGVKVVFRDKDGKVVEMVDVEIVFE